MFRWCGFDCCFCFEGEFCLLKRDFLFASVGERERSFLIVVFS